MKKLILILLVYAFVSCNETRQVKYSGFNDLVVGSHTISFFENGEFELELGLGYNTGKYQLSNDTAYLTYSKQNKQPKRVVITDHELVVLDDKESIAIRRTDNLNPEKEKPKIRIKEKLPKNIRIKTKLLVVDGRISNNLNYCEGDIKQYLEMGKYDCSFSINSVEFNLRTKFVFDSIGRVQSYWAYKSEGPIIYEKFDLNKDPKFSKSIGADIAPIIEENIIIYGKDTFEIEAIDEELNLIFMKPQKRHNGLINRTIFEYE